LAVIRQNIQGTSCRNL